VACSERQGQNVILPELVILRAVMMLKSAPGPCLVFVSRPVQNRCICTFLKEYSCSAQALKQSRSQGFNERSLSQGFNEIFLALTPTTHILPFGTK